MEDKEPVKVLANVRDLLLPLVDSENCICGDMVSCTVSNYNCVECLAEQIVKQFGKGINSEEESL